MFETLFRYLILKPLLILAMPILSVLGVLLLCKFLIYMAGRKLAKLDQELEAAERETQQNSRHGP